VPEGLAEVTTVTSIFWEIFSGRRRRVSSINRRIERRTPKKVYY
jgi:hypothetical protein